MDTINRLIQSLKCVLLVVILIDCRGLKMEPKYYQEVKDKLCDEHGVYDISYGNRYGEEVISISCISKDECEKIKNIICDKFEGRPLNQYKRDQLHFSSSIWGTGELLPQIYPDLNDFHYEEKQRAYVSKGVLISEADFKNMQKQELEYWMSLKPEQQKDWIKNHILKWRKKIPNYANCGDKFLKD